jgi:hypothetical protein
LTKQYPDIFDFKRKRGESQDAYMLRMRETNSQTTKYNWAPQDTGRGVRQTKVGGNQWQKPAKPFPG